MYVCMSICLSVCNSNSARSTKGIGFNLLLHSILLSRYNLGHAFKWPPHYTFKYPGMALLFSTIRSIALLSYHDWIHTQLQYSSIESLWDGELRASGTSERIRPIPPDLVEAAVILAYSKHCFP